MKTNIKHLVALLAAALSFAACDFLDEYDPNATTKGNYYTSESDIDASVNGVYASLTQNYYLGANSFHFTDVRAHSTICQNSGANSGIPYQFYNFTLTEENTYVYNRYTSMYKTISRANTTLAHLDDVTYSAPETRNIYEAEVRFVRALTYFYLVTEWGDVPLILTELTTKDEVAAANHRVPKQQIYQAIFDDLDFVISSPLRTTCPASECGRASKAAAYALAGKARLQQACDEDFAAEQSASLEIAIRMLGEAWNLRTFGSLSDIPYEDIWSLAMQKGCPENIFQLNFIQGNADLGSAWNYQFGPTQTGVTSMKSGQAYNCTTVETYELFDPADLRRRFLRKFTQSGVDYYHTMKYADLECGPDGYGGNNWIVLRYADVALMLAEAYERMGDEAQAKTWLNTVRQRAGLGDWSGSDLRQGIYDERLFEFIQEGLRWQDMLRRYNRMEMILHYNAINPNFGLKDLLLPIPYNERILNPEGLYQNPGYTND